MCGECVGLIDKSHTAAMHLELAGDLALVPVRTGGG